MVIIGPIDFRILLGMWNRPAHLVLRRLRTSESGGSAEEVWDLLKKSCTSWATSGIPTGWGPLVISWFITRMKYRYLYYEPKLLELFAPTWRTIWHQLKHGEISWE